MYKSLSTHYLIEKAPNNNTISNLYCVPFLMVAFFVLYSPSNTCASIEQNTPKKRTRFLCFFLFLFFLIRSRHQNAIFFFRVSYYYFFCYKKRKRGENLKLNAMEYKETSTTTTIYKKIQQQCKRH